jgi:hypothetical protein
VPQKAHAKCGRTGLAHLGHFESWAGVSAKCEARRRLCDEVRRWPGNPIVLVNYNTAFLRFCKAPFLYYIPAFMANFSTHKTLIEFSLLSHDRKKILLNEFDAIAESKHLLKLQQTNNIIKQIADALSN